MQDSRAEWTVAAARKVALRAYRAHAKWWTDRTDVAVDLDNYSSQATSSYTLALLVVGRSSTIVNAYASPGGWRRSADLARAAMGL